METQSQYKTVTFSISECDSAIEAEEELKKWIEKKTDLMSNIVNQEIKRLVLDE
jgi:hypothetical protein